MAAIRSVNTAPELMLRRLLRQAGAKGYRLHRSDVVGRPDMAFMRYRLAVFVDGAYWHGHPSLWPPDRVATPYWTQKIARNRARDQEVNVALHAAGWEVVRIWDCDLLDEPERAVGRVLDALTERGWSRGGPAREAD